MVFLEILILISAIAVTLAPSLIRSALFLMLTFLLSGLYLSIIGAELLALLFLLVYIGAISVLFLFVIMLIQVSKNQVIQFTLKKDSEELPIFEFLFSSISFFFIIFFVYLIFLSLCYSFPITYTIYPTIINQEFSTLLYETSNVYSLGSALFINYWLAFVIITFIILVASFGVIVILK